MNQTSVFIVSAPSGSGKSTMVRHLLETVPDLVFSISYTTRAPRGKEQNRLSYNFVTREEFQRMIERSELLEHATLFGKDWYGTSRRFLEEAQRRGADLVLDIDVQGAEQIKKQFPDAVSTFILPPSRNELEKRLRKRGEDPPEVIERRLRRAVGEIQNYKNYDYVIINDDKDKAAEKLCAIVLASRWKRRNDGSPGDAQVQRWFELANSCLTRQAEPFVSPIEKDFLEAKQ